MSRRLGLPDPVRRVADVSGLIDLRATALAVERLEEAVGENARLAGPLDDVIGRIEQSLVPLLEQMARDE